MWYDKWHLFLFFAGHVQKLDSTGKNEKIRKLLPYLQTKVPVKFSLKSLHKLKKAKVYHDDDNSAIMA